MYARRRGIRGYPTRIRTRGGPRLGGRHAVAAFKALGGVSADSEMATTEVPLEWIGRALAEALASVGRGGEDAWKNMDVAVYLFEAVATRSGTLTVRLSSEFAYRLRGAEICGCIQQGVTAKREYRAVVWRQHLW